MARDVEYNLTADDKTGDALRKAEGNFRKSTANIKKETDKLGTGLSGSLLKSLDKVAPSLAKNIAKGLGTAGDLGGPALAVGILAAAPLIGAGISGAIIGGAGIGGVIGGVLLAARDPRIQTAGKNLGQKLLGNLQSDASPFVQPILNALKTVDKGFDGVRSHIQSIFANSAKFVSPLTDGLVSFAQSAVRAFDTLISKAGPAIDAIRGGMVELGQATEQFASIIASGGPEAADALKVIFDVLANGLIIAGQIIGGLTKIFGVFEKVAPAALGRVVKGFVGDTDTMRQSSDDASTSFFGMATAVEAAAAPIPTLADRMNALAQTARTLFDSTTDVGDAVKRFKDSLEANGRSLDSSTEKGRANRTAISNLAKAYQGQYQAAVALNGVGAKSDAVAQSNYNSFIRLATSLTGSRKRAQELAGQLGLLPSNTNVKVSANTYDAKGKLVDIRSEINRIPNSKTIDVNVVVHESQIRKVNNTLSRLGGKDFSGNSGAAYGVAEGDGRTGGATPVSSTVENFIYLDGRLLARDTDYKISTAIAKNNYRNQTGTR